MALNCHLHKLKCDKKLPCLHCTRRKKKCIYKDGAKQAEAEAESESEASTSLDTIASSSSSLTNRALLDIIESVAYSSNSNEEDWSTARVLSDTHEELRRDTSQVFHQLTNMTKRRQELYFGEISSVQGVIPSSGYASHTWFDHLLTMFEPNKTAG